MNTKKIFLSVIIGFGVATVSAQQLPYRNPALSPEERTADLCSRLTLEEKAALMQNNSPAIPRLGIPQFAWWSEALHGIGRNGYCTLFPSCIGMAASFDDVLLEKIYTAISDEGRAKNTAQRKKGTVATYQGLSFWTPNINIFRDPRWGRGQETYGEDPYMNSRMGQAVVRGLQGPEGHRYMKLLACAKHFAVHSGPEKTRHHFNIEDLSPRDLWETYLPAFRDLVEKAKVREVMCAYQRFEGQPCCGSTRLLQQILRNDWKFNGLVVSDCGAVSDFWMKGRHGVSTDAASASAKAVASGTDVECGSNYKRLPEAVRAGEIKEEQVDVSVRRLLKARFELGDFDDDSLVEWTKIPESVVASKEHKQLALRMAREQMVLLQNRNNILPLSKTDSRIMVMGPNAADSLVLWGIYFGQPTHSVTVLEGINRKLGRNVPYAKATDITAVRETESLFDRFVAPDGKPGMAAKYWNNTQMNGEPCVETHYSAGLNFDNGGNTAFAAGVNLDNFTAQYRGSFVAKEDGMVQFNFSHSNGTRLIVNGDTIYNRWKKSILLYNRKQLEVKAGQRYDVQLDYMQLTGGATLSFDMARVNNLTPRDVVAKAKDAETVIFVGGISPNLEREEAKVSEPGFDNGDRTSIELPEAQRQVLKALHEAGKKIVFVNCSGSAVAMAPETETCDAILQAWYPGEQGGNAVADVLFGDYNPSGKLPVTFYRDDSQLPPFDDYSMANRTYRYFRGQPLFPFGYGLSYTSFRYGKPEYDARSGKVRVSVANCGGSDGTEIVQVYLRCDNDTDGPVKTLRGFKRIELKAGETQTVEVDMPRESFECWDKNSNTMRVMKGKYTLLVGSSSLEKDLQTVRVKL